MKTTEFVNWALSPERTDEEAYFAERVVEWGTELWRSKEKLGRARSWDEERELRKRRRLNPAHRVKLKKTDVERAAGMVAERNDLYLHNYDDRPIRDITGVRFLTHLRKLDLGQTEIADLTPLTALPEVEELAFNDDVVEDLRPVATLTKLRNLRVTVRQPWPVVDGWGALQQLEMLHWHGNLLTLEGLGSFPRLRDAWLNKGYSHLPLRDATRLPDMPALEYLQMDGIHRLDGIERWAQLRNLKLQGTFRNLEPLAKLSRVTHLELNCDQPLDLAPLCRMAELRSFKLTSVQPCELFVLTDAPRLHEVEVSRCEANERELPTLQEVLKPWDGEFLAPTPRPLAPLQFVIEERDEKGHQPRRYGERANRFEGNRGMQGSEDNWLSARLQTALDKAMGGPDWGKASLPFVYIYNIEAVERLPEIVEAVRRVLAECLNKRWVMLHTDLKADWGKRDKKDWKDPEEEELKREREEWKDFKARQREEAELREREHRLRQLRQEGVKVNPEEFEPEPEPPEVVDEEEDAVDDDPFDEGEPHPLAEENCVYGDICEEGFYLNLYTIEAGERLMGRKADRR